VPLGLVFCLVLILVNREGATDSQPVHEVSPRTTPAPTTSSHQSRPPNETRITALGVSAGGPDATASFERWLGRPVDLSHAFLPERTWGEIEVGAGWARWWGGSAYADRMLISVPMLPEDDPSATPIPGVLIHRFEAELIFANADIFQDDLLAKVRALDPPPHTVILDFEAISQLDVTGAQTLRSVHDTLEARGIRLIVARAKSTVRDTLRRNGIVDLLGADNLVPTVDRAVDLIQADATAVR